MIRLCIYNHLLLISFLLYLNTAKEDEENKKLRGALASTIISEKPNIKWSDVAGTDNIYNT